MKDFYYCTNKELLKELEDKEKLFLKIHSKIIKCPKCKTGHFFIEHDDREYSNESWWMCSDCDYYPSKQREKMLNEIAAYGIDEYWDFGLYMEIRQFEYGFTDCWEDEKKKRDFNPEEWNKEKHYKYIGGLECEEFCDKKIPITWEDLVEETIKEHIKALDTAIERAKQYKMLKSIFKKESK